MGDVRKAAREAQRRYNEIRETARKAGEAARANALDDFAAAIKSARDELNLANDAFHAAQETAAQSNPLIGRKVYRPAVEATWRYGGRPRLDGIIELFKRGDEIASGYRPQPGSLVIRHLKKNGDRGKKIDTMPGDQIPHDWKFADEAKP